MSRIIQIQHGSHRVHAQPVDVIFVNPEQRIGNQEILHLVAAVIEYQRPPIGMAALPRIGMLVQMCAVKFAESMAIAREVRGSPIQNDTPIPA